MTSRVLMCRPEHYRIDYEINPWMHRANAVDGPRALLQWDGLVNVFRERGVEISLVPQVAGLPDMTFTANAGVVVGKRFFPANFRFPERQPEAAYFVHWFQSQGFEIVPVHDPHVWEGEGDVLDGGTAVFAGFRFRTEGGALDHLEEALGVATVRLALVDPRFYHLDTCFCPLGKGRALYFPDAFGDEARRALRDAIPDLFAVPEEEALRFACNAVMAPGETVVLNAGCPQTERALNRWGLEAVATPMDEFIKAGGSVKCLVLSLDSFGSFGA